MTEETEISENVLNFRLNKKPKHKHENANEILHKTTFDQMDRVNYPLSNNY